MNAVDRKSNCCFDGPPPFLVPPIYFPVPICCSSSAAILQMMHRLATSRCSIRSFVGCSEALSSRCAVSGARVTSALPTFHHQNTISQHRPSRHFSSSSHDDFSPQKKHNLNDDSDESKIMDLIDSHVKQNRIMLYMKGSPAQPMCGFSATVVQLLKNSGADFASVNVLDYPEVREGVKKYAQWPTIPQLYVDGEFVGGCDIVKDLDESGELGDMLKGGEEKKEE